MSKFAALFALLNAALVSSSVLTRSAAAVASKGLVSDSADAITVLTTCTEQNLDNCLVWSGTTLPVGCTSTAASGQASDINSVETASGILCTLFASTTCTGASQIINGTLDNLAVVGYANTANSFTCVSN